MIFEIYTPEKLFLKGEAVSVTVPCADGELCVMDRHMPLAASLAKGKLKIRTIDGLRSFGIESGFAKVKNNTVIIFVENIKRCDDQTA